MKNNLKVSIVIPVYNGSNYMREAIDSALSQTYKNIEIIVVNDGSNDSGLTENIALSYGNKIKYFYKKNGGQASAVNFGISKMTGDFFCWLSHDDLYLPYKVKTQIEFLKNLGRTEVILYSDFEYIDAYGKTFRSKKIPYISPDKMMHALITTSFPINGNSVLIPKLCFDRAGLFNESIPNSSDYDMWFRLSKYYDFFNIPKILIKCRIHLSQMAAKYHNVCIDETNRYYINCLKNISPEKMTSISPYKTLRDTYLKLVILYSRGGYYQAYKEAIKYYFNNIYIKPHFIKNLLKFVVKFMSSNIYYFFQFKGIVKRFLIKVLRNN